ncbi:MAG TPA: tetratricopeptide repeat protein, partial [Candidatus Eremiobacteraeota bacterium]|nr:tetratricopeptide repeat protein [Candidatus Eremiobacteraeota bacterium]
MFAYKKLIFIIIITIIIYSGIFRSGFVWDDHFVILENRDIQVFSWETIKNCFTPGKVDPHTYVPLSYIFIAFNYYLWKINPSGYHVCYFILYLLQIIIIYIILLKLFNRENLAFLGTLFFAVHPIHVETVAWIIGAFYVPANLLMYISFYLYMKFTDKKNKFTYLWLSLICYLVGTFFFPVVYLPVLLLLYGYCFKREKMKFIFLSSLPFFFISLLNTYLGLIVGITGRRIHENNVITPLIINNIFGKYIFNIFIPINLSPFYPIEELYTHSAIYLTISILSLIGIIILLSKSRIYLFCWGWFFISLLPYSHIVIPFNWTMADRYLYAPSFGFCLFIALIFEKLLDYLKKPVCKQITTIIIILLILFYSLITVSMVEIWKDDISLWKYTVKKAPHSPYIIRNLAISYFNMNLFDDSLLYYKRLLKLKASVETYTSIANIEFLKDNYEEALKNYKEAIKLKPDSSELHRSIAIVYYNMGKSKEAITGYRNAWKCDFNPKKFYGYLGMIYHEKGFVSRAIIYYKRSLMLNPDCKDIKELLYIVYLENFLRENDSYSDKNLSNIIKETIEANNLALNYINNGE